jgi:AcrR family transcriptional regulator
MNYKLKSIHFHLVKVEARMTGLRERQKAGRKRDILAAAGELFRRDGYADTSIESIAATADLAAGTVYNYFQSKGDLLLALVALDGEEVRAAGREIIASPPKDPVQALNKLLAFYVDHSLVHLSKELWRNAMATALTQAAARFGMGYAELDRKLADQVGEMVAVLQRRGQIDQTVDPQIAGDLLFEIVNSLFTIFVTREAMPIQLLKKMLLEQVRLLFTGLMPDSAVQRAPERKRA